MGDDAFNFVLPAGGEQTLQFVEPQRLPRPVSCNIHPYMQGWLLVRDNPYMDVSEKDGTIEIANLPAGEHEFQFWHEMAGYLKNAPRDGGQLDRRGRLTVTIPNNGEVDLGVIQIPAELLADE